MSFFAKILYRIDKRQEMKINKDLNLTDTSGNLLNGFEFSKFFDPKIFSKSINDIKLLDKKIWVVSAVLIFFYNGITPFWPQGVQFFMTKYQLDSITSGRLVSMVDLISAILAPFVGIIADKYKINILFAEIGIFLALFGDFLLAFSFFDPFICMFFIGLGYSTLSSSLWPYINLNIPFEKIGSINGTISSLQSLILGSVIIASGRVLETKGYFQVLNILIVNLMAALCLNTNFLTWK